MHLSLAFFFLLTTPLPSVYGSNETKISTKSNHHDISLTSPKSTSPPIIKPAPTIKQTQTHTTPPMVSSATQILTSLTKPVMTSNVEKTSEDKSLSTSPVTVIINKGCIQKDTKKDTVNSTNVKETELNLDPGSPLVMTHHINLVPGPCTGGCEVQMAALMDRVELLEKEMLALKKKCSLCSEEQCLNNCSSQGRCERGKCICHHGFSGTDCSATSCSSGCSRNAKCENGKCVCKVGFTGTDCSKGISKNTEVKTITLSSESGTATNNTVSEKQTDKTEKKTHEKEQQGDKHLNTPKTSTNKPAVESRTDKDQSNTTTTTFQKQMKNTTQKPQNNTSDKTEHKDMSLNRNLTQSSEKIVNGTQSGSNQTTRLNVKTSVGSGNGHETSVNNVTASTEKDQGEKKLEKQQNVFNITKTVQKDKKASITLHKDRSVVKKNEDKQLIVISSSKKDQSTNENRTTLTEAGSPGKKILAKLLNVTTVTVKNKTLHQGNITLLNNGPRKLDALNVTTISNKKLLNDDKTSLNVPTATDKDKTVSSLVKEATYAKQTDKKTLIHVENHLNISSKNNNKNSIQVETASYETVKKTPLQVKKHLNVTTSTEKDTKIPIQAGKNLNITNSLVKGNKTTTKMEKHLNVTVSTTKDNKKLNKIKNDLNVTVPTENGNKNSIQLEITANEKNKKTLIQVKKHLNATTSPEKGKVTKTQVEKQISVTSFTEKVTKAPIQVRKYLNASTFTERPKKTTTEVEKHVILTTSTEKDTKTPIQVRKHVNVTSSSEKNNKTPAQVGILNITTSTLKGNRTTTKVENVTVFIDNKNSIIVDTTSTEKRKKTPIQMGKHLNVTISNEKDTKTPIQVRKHLNETTSTVKVNKKINQVEKDQHVTISSSKDNKKPTQKHSNETLSTDKSKNTCNETTFRKINVRMHGERENQLLQDSKTTLRQVTPGQRNVTTFTKLKKPVKEHLNVSSPIDKDQKLHQGDATLSKKASSEKRKVDSNVGAKMSTEKLLQGDKTKVIKKITSENENKSVNVTTSNESDNIIDLKNDAPGKKNANSRLNVEKHKKFDQGNKTHTNRTTRLTDISAVEVHNITATGFVITWEAPQGVIRNFTIVRREVLSGQRVEHSAEKLAATGNELHSSNQTSGKAHAEKADRKSTEKFSQVLAGSARVYHFKNLRPQTKYSVSLYSYGPWIRSKIHHLLVSTGPESPKELIFSNITETSLLVYWTKPKSKITGFTVTYINSANGVTGSMTVDSQLSHVLISKLIAGSTYKISVRSVLGAIESEPTTASVVTVPDSPTNLQATNVTDSKALLLWKPAKSKVDNYYLSYGSSKSSNVTVTVMLSGNSVEHQLRGLHRSTLYTVKIMSQINDLQSSSVSTTFTTSSGVKVQVVKPSNVTCHSAMISWKAPHVAFKSYRLTYQKEEDVKEVILNPTVSRYELTDLMASSNYIVKVDGESEGQYISVVSSAFTTAQPPYPYPAECSQVQQNGKKESGEAEIYPEGKDGEPVWVYCDMETAGGGWTAFQRRLDGSLDFFRGWKDFSKGFGNLSAEFWLGNEMLHKLTSLVPMSLRIDLRLGNDTAFAFYSSFSVGSEMAHYVIGLSGYSGTAGNSMSYHNGHPFSTKDKDPSPKNSHCAKSYRGGWWYNNCYKANLNGHYATNSQDQGVVWIDWKGKDVSLPFTEMKLRPASLNHLTPMTQG